MNLNLNALPLNDQDSSASQSTPEMLPDSMLASLDHLELDKYDGRHGKPLGARVALSGAHGLDVMMERDLLTMEQNQRLLAENRSYSVLVGQLESQLARYQTKSDKQAAELVQLQQQLSLQAAQGEQKFNQFLVCANQYEQSKAKEIEQLKLQLVQKDHLINTLRASLQSAQAQVHQAQQQQHRHGHSHAHAHHPMTRHFGLHRVSPPPTSSGSSSNGPSYFEHLSVEQKEALRVRQKNIVYVIGLPVSLCNAKLLKSNKWFGKFGPISRVCFNTSPKCVKANSIPTFVTYEEERDALQAIRRMNLYCLADGTRLKTNFGRTKFCPLFCRAEQCLNEKCKFLHAWADHEDIITEQEITDFNAIRAGPPSRFNRK